MAKPVEDVPRIVELLWGGTDATARRGPRQRTSVGEIVQAGIALADQNGLDQVSMRALAAQVGLKPMGLYTYVPNRDVLVALMVDAVARETDFVAAGSLAQVLEAIAEQYRTEFLQHPWLLDVRAWRPIPGPGSSRRYEHQLRALSAAAEQMRTEFSDVDLDAIIASVRAFALGNARARIDQIAEYADSGMTDEQWWGVAGPLLADSMPTGEYPISSRVGSTVGELFAGPGNADHAYQYGLARLVAGIVDDAERRAGPAR